jgi:sphinganine-1-phosphate aldolase
MYDIVSSLLYINKSTNSINLNYLTTIINYFPKIKLYYLYLVYYTIIVNHIKRYKLNYFSIISLLYITNNIRYYYGINSIKDLLLTIPYIKEKINMNLKKSSQILEKTFDTNYNFLTEMPNDSLDELVINQKITEMSIKSDKSIKEQEKTKISGSIYINNKEHENKLVEVFKQFSYSNPLQNDIYPQINMMEIDIINMCRNLYKGDKNCCGNVTSGGTESLLLACLTYRDYYYDRGIHYPNIVAPETIHPAVDKACHYFNIKLVKIPIHKNTGTIIANDIYNYIDYNTIFIIGSAPNYSYGTIDPLEEMGKIANNRNIGFHIDCCMGGFLIPFLDNFNYINFKLKGVTSISMDTHKYGYSLKGSSVILYNNYKLKKYQHTINSKWNGGIYATPTIMGSKSGGLIAAAWASLLYVGKSNFIKYSEEIVEKLNNIKNNFKYNEYIEIVGDPKLNIIAFISKTKGICIYKIVELMKHNGWRLNILQNPPSFHFCITRNHTNKIINDFCNDLNLSIKKIIEIIKNKNYKEKELTGTLAFYGSTQEIGAYMFINEIIHDYVFLQSNETISFRYL